MNGGGKGDGMMMERGEMGVKWRDGGEMERWERLK